MLNINHPRTQLIFQAAGYLDRIRDYSRKFILENYDFRQKTFNNIIDECQKLNHFSESVFPEKIDEIKSLTNKIIFEVEKLKVINQEVFVNNCQVCNGELITSKTYIKEFPIIKYCNHCTESITKYLTELEGPTETKWI